MLVLAWGAGLLLATHFFGKWEDGRDHPNRQPQSIHGSDYVEVRLASSRGGHYVADGQINGRAVTFLLDTGASQVAIPSQAARALGLRPGAPVQISTANGRATAHRTRLERLQLGDIVLRDVPALIAPGMDGEEILLGMSALQHLEFSQKGGSLLLRQSTLQ